MVLIRIRYSLARFLTALDSEGVGIFQTIVYFHLAVGGAYGVFVAGVPLVVAEALSPTVNTAWLWLCIGAAVCMAGKALSARPSLRKYWVNTTGLLLQLAGDIFACGAFAGYVISTFQTSYWGKELIAVWVFFGLADCAALLVWRDMRRIKQAERMVRR